MLGWDDAIGAALKIVDKVIPDPEKKAALQLEIMRAQQDGVLNEFKAEVEDRASARMREAAVKDRTPAVLAALAIVGFIILVVYTAVGQAPSDKMHDTFMMLSGAAVAFAKDVYGYYFGSSRGSQTKDLTINKLTGGK